MDLTCCLVLSRQATSEEQHETLTATMSLCHSDCDPGDLVPLRSHITCSEKLLLMWVKGLEMQLISFGLSFSLSQRIKQNKRFQRPLWKKIVYFSECPGNECAGDVLDSFLLTETKQTRV